MSFVVTALLGLSALSAFCYRYFLHAKVLGATALVTTLRRMTVRSGDDERESLVYVPAALPPGAPLVIVLHGSAMTAEDMRKATGYEFDRLADASGYALAYPEGFRHNWNDCRSKATFAAKRRNIDDVQFILTLIDRLHAEYAIDRSRVFVFGYSNGGHMAFRLAQEAPERIAAVVSVAANMPSLDCTSCSAHGPTSRIMMVNGTHDPVNPYDGGEVSLFGFRSRGEVMSAITSARHLAGRNGLIEEPEVRPILLTPGKPSWVQGSTWWRDGVPIISLCTVHGGGHAIPQSMFRFPRLLGYTNPDMNSPHMALAFFDID